MDLSLGVLLRSRGGLGAEGSTWFPFDASHHRGHQAGVPCMLLLPDDGSRGISAASSHGAALLSPAWG